MAYGLNRAVASAYTVCSTPNHRMLHTGLQYRPLQPTCVVRQLVPSKPWGSVANDMLLHWSSQHPTRTKCASLSTPDFRHPKLYR